MAQSSAFGRVPVLSNRAVPLSNRPHWDLGCAAMLAPEKAYREAEDLRRQFPVLYRDAEVLVTAPRGAQTYRISWFDAHLWAYAEVNGLAEILTEDFEHGRHHGSVRVVDPFLAAAGDVYELPMMYDGADS